MDSPRQHSSNQFTPQSLFLHWMSPGDLQYSKLLELLEDPNYKFTDSHHEGGCNAARSDCSPIFLRESMSQEAIKSALQFNDGVFLDF